jgi:hypothetical protein
MITIPTRLLTASSINMQNWEEKNSKIKEKFPHLAETDLDFEAGNVCEMIKKIHSKIGMTRGNTQEGLHKYIEMLNN